MNLEIRGKLPNPPTLPAPVSDGHEAKQQGTEERNQLLLQLLPDRSPHVVGLLPSLRLRQNQQLQERIWALQYETGKKCSFPEHMLFPAKPLLRPHS